jgi:hypothetical protein
MRAGPQQANGFNVPLCRILAYKVVVLYIQPREVCVRKQCEFIPWPAVAILDNSSWMVSRLTPQSSCILVGWSWSLDTLLMHPGWRVPRHTPHASWLDGHGP